MLSPAVVVGRGRAIGAARLLVCLLAFSGVRPAAAQQDDRELAARTHYLTGEYKQALDGYVQLYAETLHPTYLRNIGRCFQRMGEADKAIDAFRDYLRKAPSLTVEQRAEIDGFIREMNDLKRSREAEKAPAAVAAAPASAPLPRATEPTARPDAGQAMIVASETPGERPGVGPAPIYKRFWFWTTVAAVVVAAGATAVILSSSSSGTPATDFGIKQANPK
jgi:tetratricopeptide (TPR) repeat protein